MNLGDQVVGGDLNSNRVQKRGGFGRKDNEFCFGPVELEMPMDYAI